MKLVQVKNANDIWFDQIYDLYERSFPASERREKHAFIDKVEHEPLFHCTAIVFETNFAGLFTYWKFEDFLYVEHFAISEKLRGNNLGSRLISRFVQECPIPVVLEVEKPETVIAKRRIAFYERHDFHIVRKDYVQPPYRQAEQPVPMFLMGTMNVFTDDQIRTLQQTVYGIQ